MAQVLRQPLDHLGAPALRGLPGEDVAAELPIQQHQLAVHRQRSALLGAVDAALQAGRPASRRSLRAGAPGWRSCAHHACNQFSTASPGTRENSTSFVTRVAPSARAWAAIRQSLAPMGVPACSSRVRSWA